MFFKDPVQDHLDTRQFVRELAEWCPPFHDYHLYYPSRRQPTPAFALLVDAEVKAGAAVQAICDAWTKDPVGFDINPHHRIPGPHS